MGTYSEEKRDMDDSGCIRDSSPSKTNLDDYKGSAQLLDLSDDVLLFILRHLSPRDLKALGFTCPRLGSLILDRSLWNSFDSRDEQCGRARLQWYLSHVVHDATIRVHLTGLAQLSMGCNGLSSTTREEEEAKAKYEREKRQLYGFSDDDDDEDGNSSSRSARYGYAVEQCYVDSAIREPPYPLFRQHARMHINAHQLPRNPDRSSGVPSWPEDSDDEVPNKPGLCSGSPSGPEANSQCAIPCWGPQFTLSQSLLRHLKVQCPNLLELSLEYCNINCRTTGISKFPPGLKKLSLRGTKCFNLPVSKSYLYKIHDYLPFLKELDVSECDWLEPAALLPLSKMPMLHVLHVRNCYAMREFVAYASLATRYGFKELKVLDFRGSPLGDSEVSALGWIANLEELYLSPPPLRNKTKTGKEHLHFKEDYLPAFVELDDWETEEPEHFRLQPVLNDSDSSASSNGEGNLNNCDQNGVLQTVKQERETVKRERETDSGTSANNNAPSSSNQNEAPKRCLIREIGCIDTLNEPGPSKKRKDSASNKPRKNSGTGNKPNVSELDEGGDLNIFVSKEAFKRGNKSLNKEIAKALREQKLAAARARGEKVINVRENVRFEFVREGEVDSDTSDEDNGGAKEDCNKRKIHDGEGNNDDINQPGPSKRYKEADAKDKNKGKTDSDKSKNSKSKDDQNDNRQDSDNNDDDDDNDAPNERSRICQIAVDAFLPERPVYLMPNANISRREERLWRKRARGRRNSAQNSERSVRNGKHTSRNGKNSSRNNESSSKKGKKAIQNGEKSSENQPSTSSNRNGSDSSQNKPSTSNNDATSGMPLMRYAGSCTVDLYNQEPVVIECSMIQQEEQERPVKPERPEQQDNQEGQINQERPEQQENQERQIVPRESRQHILYVNLGRPQQANVFRLVQHTPRMDPQVSMLHRHSHIHPNALVSDAAIRRFGRADGEDIVVHIGPNGPYAGNRQDIGGRPNRSSLRILSVTGYRHVTDRSLIHLATAAPNLQRIDFSQTSVTERGVENFRLTRPDCEITYSTFENNDTERNT